MITDPGAGDEPERPSAATTGSGPTSRWLDEVVRRLPIALLLVGLDRQIVDLNEAAARLVDRGPLPRLTAEDGTPFPPGDEPLEAAVRSGRVVRRRPVGWTSRDGRVLRASVTVTPILDEHGTTSACGLLIEDPRHVDGAALGDTIVGMLSHELRTPVTAIYGGSQLLLHPDLPVDLRASVVGDIAQEAERLHRLIEDLLAIARTERGLSAPPREPVLIQRVALTIADQERRRRPWADVDVHADLDLPPVIATEDEVRQILRNLLSNALASAGAAAVTITASLRGDEVVTSVMDRGPGLAAAAGDDAFRLYHGRPAIARQVPGTGVELFVARALVESLGGRIWIEARPGGGTVISLALPRFDDADAAPPGPDDPGPLGAPQPRRRASALGARLEAGVAGGIRGAV